MGKLSDHKPEQEMILLSAGGTGGHVFPARALAEELLSKNYRVAVATDTRGLKYFEGLDQSVERHVIASGAYTSGLKGKISGILALARGYVQSHGLISRLKPSVVVGFGGYPSAPPVFAAQHRGIPTILHEQNAILGMANALLAPKAKKLALSASHTTGLKPEWCSKCVTTGNPVRRDIADLGETSYPNPAIGIFYLMVVGGSQGAKCFAEIVPKSIAALPSELHHRLFVYHQTRADDLEMVKQAYEGKQFQSDVRPFFSDMAGILSKTHLLITRSGASTIAELSAAGRPAIYVPFPWNRDQQQLHNAAQMEKEEAGLVIEEKTLTVESLTKTLTEMIETPEKLEHMARKAHTIGIRDAAKRLEALISREIPVEKH